MPELSPDFSSLIEILTGFNFALVASNAFLRELSIRITSNSEAFALNKTAKGIAKNQINVDTPKIRAVN